jgi:hypothetical protein
MGVLADIVVLVHFLWIIFLIFGAFLGVSHRAVRAVHFSGLAFAVVMQVFGWYCPLTHLENWLRSRHDPSAAYEGSFIIRYLEEVVYLEVSPRLIFICTLVLAALNAWAYLRKPRRH